MPTMLPDAEGGASLRARLARARARHEGPTATAAAAPRLLPIALVRPALAATPLVRAMALTDRQLDQLVSAVRVLGGDGDASARGDEPESPQQGPRADDDPWDWTALDVARPPAPTPPPRCLCGPDVGLQRVVVAERDGDRVCRACGVVVHAGCTDARAPRSFLPSSEGTYFCGTSSRTGSRRKTGGGEPAGWVVAQQRAASPSTRRRTLVLEALEQWQVYAEVPAGDAFERARALALRHADDRIDRDILAAAALLAPRVWDAQPDAAALERAMREGRAQDVLRLPDDDADARFPCPTCGVKCTVARDARLHCKLRGALAATAVRPARAVAGGTGMRAVERWRPSRIMRGADRLVRRHRDNEEEGGDDRNASKRMRTATHDEQGRVADDVVFDRLGGDEGDCVDADEGTK